MFDCGGVKFLDVLMEFQCDVEGGWIFIGFRLMQFIYLCMNYKIESKRGDNTRKNAKKLRAFQLTTAQ